MKIVGFLQPGVLPKNYGVYHSKPHRTPPDFRGQTSMVASTYRVQRTAVLNANRGIVVRQANKETAKDVIRFFLENCTGEKTLVNRSSSEIMQWIEDEQVIFAQKNDNCIGVARVLKLSMISSLKLDPIVKDFKLGFVERLHEGHCKNVSELIHSTRCESSSSIAVHMSATVYVSSFCVHPQFRRTLATPMLIHEILGKTREQLRVKRQKLQDIGGISIDNVGVLFGTTAADQVIWKLACKCMQREVNSVFGNNAEAKYLTFLTSYPNGAPARGNFVYF